MSDTTPEQDTGRWERAHAPEPEEHPSRCRCPACWLERGER